MNLKNSNIYEFCQLIKNKKVICFGASKLPQEICSEYKDLNLESYIDFFVDNDKNKWNKEIKINESKFKIYSPEVLKGDKVDNHIIFITSNFFNEIIKQLENFEEIKNLDCYVYDLFPYYKNNKDYKFEKFSNNFKIPKVIHYCWFGKGSLPPHIIKCLESWKVFCPDYDIIEWNESNYDVTKNVYMKKAYEAEKWAFVSDYARLDIIYNYGGIYLDTDVEIIKSIDDLRTYDAFIGFEIPERINTGIGFGAVKNFKLIQELRDLYESISFIKEDGALNLTPCTIIQTEFLKQKGLIINGRYQIIDGISIFPTEVLCPINYKTYEKNITENTLAVHHYNSSWLNDEQKEIGKMYHEKINQRKYDIEKMTNIIL